MKSVRRAGQRGLALADAWMNRLYGWRLNPLYHSGVLAVALLAVLIVTGIYLLLFYRIGSPYASVARLTDQAWAGRWIRGLHRFASDASVVAVAVHALRLLLQGRSWGPRTLAWISGLVLLFCIFVCGWTGYVLVWDVQGAVLAREGARLLDLLPIFSEPLGRGFVGERPIPATFFFFNLFLHSALPIGLGILLWLHTSRVARPTLLPPRPLLGASLGLLLLLSVVWPVAMAPPADPFLTAGRAPYDVFFSFWLPFARAVTPWVAWLAVVAVAALLLAVPLLSRPAAAVKPAPSFVDERLCTGCEQCYVDCPYEAISMISRTDTRGGLVAQVDQTLCVSCGICAGSCAPMGVGPPGRTGRDQLSLVREFATRYPPQASQVTVVACNRALVTPDGNLLAGSPVLSVSCAGSLHTSVIEYLVRTGAGGVLVVSCPPRDCWNREGPKWLEQRVYHDREAELQERVDRRRVRVVYRAQGERRELLGDLYRYREEVRAMNVDQGEREIDLERECETPTDGAAK